MKIVVEEKMQVWIDFFESQSKENRTWINGTTANPAHIHWNNDEPNNKIGEEDCATIWISSKKSNDAPCGQNHPGVFETLRTKLSCSTF